MISLALALGAGTPLEPAAAASAVFTAHVRPAILAVRDDTSLAETLPVSATDPANYLSRKGAIVSATAEWSVDAGPWTLDGTARVRTGAAVRARVAVVDSAGNAFVFGAGTTVVLPQAPRLAAPLAAVLSERGQTLAPVEAGAAFTGEGLSFTLAPVSADIAALGLALDAATGRISGRPTTLVAAAPVVVRAVNAGGQAEAGFALTVADQPEPMAAPAVTASGAGGVLVARAAAPADNHAPILRYDLRHSTDGATWTEVTAIAELWTLTGLAAGIPCQVQTRAVNALGVGPWSASGSAIVPVVAVLASRPPAMAPLYEGQSVQDVPFHAEMIAPANFTVEGDSIATVSVTFLGDAVSADQPLLEGQRAGFQVTVRTTGGAERAFATDPVTVQYASRLQTDSDNTLILDINSLVPSDQGVPVSVTSGAYALARTWPVLVSQDNLAAGPVSLLPPRLFGTAMVGETLTAESGLWTYAEADPEPDLILQWCRDGVAIDGATGTSHVLTGADAGAAITVAETAISGSRTAMAISTAVTVSVPDTVPGQVAGLSAVAGDGQVALTWTVPASDGGSPIIDYIVEYASGAGWSVFADGTSTATSATVTGLTNGTSYSFRVLAVNAIGAGEASAPVTATPASGSLILPFVDDFNRVDQLLSASPNWTAFIGSSPEIVGNVLKTSAGAATGENCVVANVDLPADQYVQMTVSEKLNATVNGYFYAFLRWQDPGNWLKIRVRANGAARVLKSVGGVETTVSLIAGVPVPLGVTLRFEAQGSTLRVNSGSTVVATVTDTTFLGAGKAGLGFINASDEAGLPIGSLDNFECGAL